MALDQNGLLAPETGFGAPPTWKGTDAEWQQLTQGATADIQASIRQGLESSQGFGDFLLGALKTLGPIAAMGLIPGMFPGTGAGAGAGAAADAATAATGAFDLGGIAGGVSGAGGSTGLGTAFGLGDAALGGTLAGSAGSAGALSSGASGSAGIGASGAGAAAAGAAEVIPSMTITGSLPAAGGLTAGQVAAGTALAGGTAAALSGGGDMATMETLGQRAVPPNSITGLTPEQIAAMTASGSGLASTVNLSDPNGSFLDKLLTPGNVLKAGTTLAGGLLGGVSAANAPDSKTATTQNQIDPRMASILYGADGKSGLLNQLVTAGNVPQDAGLKLAGQAGSNYVGQNAGYDMGQMRTAAQNLMGSNLTAPGMTAASVQPTQNMGVMTNTAVPTINGARTEQQPGLIGATVANTPNMATSQIGAVPGMQAAQAANIPGMQASLIANTPAMQAAKAVAPDAYTAANAEASKVNAPSQNNLNLSSAYDRMINGNAAENPYLTGAIQKGINQSNTAFGNYLQDQTKATQGLLGNIRGGAMLSGQYGGSRQGIAEGMAMDSFNTQTARAAAQYGQNNTDAAVAAQSGAFDAGQNRSLSAMSGLGAQQYGIASQDASMQQQTSLANQQAANQAAQAAYQAQAAASIANAGFEQQANSANYQGQLGVNAANAGYQNQAAQTNYQGAQSTNLANAGYQNQANNTNYQGLLGTATNNANLANSANQTNYQGQQQTNMANAGFQQQAGLNNYAGNQTTALSNTANQQAANVFNSGMINGNNNNNMAAINNANQVNYQGALTTAGQNAGFQQAANTNNLQSNLTTNSLNSSNQQAGINANAGLLSSAYGYGQANDAYDINKLGKTTGLLAPFTGLNSTQSNTTPLYNNVAGNIIGGATAAAGIYNAFK